MRELMGMTARPRQSELNSMRESPKLGRSWDEKTNTTANQGETNGEPSEKKQIPLLTWAKLKAKLGGKNKYHS